MSDRPPPLNALRVFEAAARHGNFSRAADELHVTHGAVSHQIRSVEDFVGVSLFRREGRGVVLNVDGQSLAAAVRMGIAQIDRAVQAIRRAHDRKRLTISVLPSFGSRWLMPRIVGFMARHPALEVNIESNPGLTDFARDDVDVAIRFGTGPWKDLHCERLLEDEYIMVASPRLFRGRAPRRLDRLADYPLLRADPEPWRQWCAAAGIDVPLPSAGVGFQDMGVMLQSAVDGNGIMLSRRMIAAAELEKGTLVQVFDVAVPAGAAYWIVWPEEPPASDRVLAFRDWLVAEAATMDRGKPARARATR